ncbi:unnamed protein product [Urochloa humidicola]
MDDDGETSGGYEATLDESSSGDIFDDASMCCIRRYAVLTEQAIRKELSQQAAFTAEALSVPADWALALLLHYRWRAYDLFFDWDSDQDAVRRAVGLPPAAAPDNDGEETVTCGICLEAKPAAATATAGCAHRYCHDCWRRYVSAAAGGGGGGAARCLALRCPDASCSRAVLRRTVERFATGGAPTPTRMAARGTSCRARRPDAAAPSSWSTTTTTRRPAAAATTCRAGAAPGSAGGAAARRTGRRAARRRRGGRARARARRGWRCTPSRARGAAAWSAAPTPAGPAAAASCARTASAGAASAPWPTPTAPRISHFDCPEVHASPEKEAERERALDGFLRHDGLWEASMAARRSAERELARLRDGGGLEKLALAWGVICRDVEFVEEAWERVAEGRRVVGNVCLFARGIEEEEDDGGDGRRRRDLLEFQLGKADEILGRLQRCVEEGPAGKGLADFSCEVRNLSCVARLFIGNFAKAVASGEVGEQPASSGKSGIGSGTLL